MTLQLTHFDTKLRLDLAVKEPVRNCLAEYLFPDASFALGEVDPETVKASDLREYQGMSLQFASGQRMYFCDRNVGELLYPNPSDRIAYGSLPFTPNRTFHELQQMRVLVIDDGTGENGGILPNEVARRLVGDCHGKLSLDMAQQLTGRDDTPFQFRLGIRPQEGNQFYRIAKGTLASDSRLDSLTSTVSYQTGRAKLGYDLVLPTSAFKGRKGEQSIAPGEYTLDLGIGVKALAEYGGQRLGTQVLVNYPKGVERDILPIAREQARELSRVQGNIHALAQTYLRMYEERQESRMAEIQGLSEDLDALGDEVDDLAEPERESQEQRLYEILKADLSHHGQLLEHPNTVNELRDAVQNLWRDIALARSIRVQSALAQPSLDLKDNEVCVSKMPDGMELIVTRSPLVNSNGVILLTNRHLPQLMRQQGVIYIHPETAAKHLQADFDGDRLAFERADRFPRLTAEIEEALKPENRYPDVVKRDKVPHQGTIEEIAVSAVKNDIGKIANQIMGAVSLRWETTLLPEEEKARYVSEAGAYYRKLLARNASPSDSFRLPDSYRETVTVLASLPLELSPDAVEEALQNLRDLQFKVVGDLSNELQVAVDGPKSALRPDQEAIAVCKILSGYRDVGWLKEKDRSKNPDLFLTRPMATANYSPIDQFARMASTYWQQHRLQERPVHQFRSLFPEPAEDFKEIAKEIKGAYNSYLSTAGTLKDIRETHPETVQPYLEVTSAKSGKTIYLTRLDAVGIWESPNVPIPQTGTFEMDLKLVENNRYPDIPNSLLVVTPIQDREAVREYPVGAIAISSVKEHNLKPGMVLHKARAELHPGITEGRIRAIYHALDEYASMVRQSHSEGERRELAAALWQSAHTKDSYQTKKALVAFRLFPEEIRQQVSQLQFQRLQVVGLHHPTNEYRGRHWQGQEVACEVALHPIPDPKTGELGQKRVIEVEGQVFAPFSGESPSLLPGTAFRAQVHSSLGASITATTRQGNSFTIIQVNKFAYAAQEWRGEQAEIAVALTSGGRGEVPLVTLNQLPLGILDKESAKRLGERNLLTHKGVRLPVTLERSAGTTAILEIVPDSIIHPWQSQTLEGAIKQENYHAQRDRYREQYQAYVQEVVRDEAFASAPRREIDREVAVRAYRDGADSQQVTCILSQSDRVLQMRETIPKLYGWEEYLAKAKEYVREVKAESLERCQIERG
jgi:hypothetical protein